MDQTGTPPPDHAATGRRQSHGARLLRAPHESAAASLLQRYILAARMTGDPLVPDGRARHLPCRHGTGSLTCAIDLHRKDAGPRRALR